MTRSPWDEAIEDYYAEHDRVLTRRRRPRAGAARRVDRTARPDVAGPADPRTTRRATTTG